MDRRMKVLATTGLVSVLATTVLVANAGSSSGGGAVTRRLPESCTQTASERARIATAKLIIEYNFTDGDMGVHGAFDDDGWRTLCVLDPTGRPVLVVGPRRQLRDLSMAGIFFESREPPTDEFSFADLRKAFPEGRYRVRAESFDGSGLFGSALFTHDVPTAPRITSPRLAAEPEAIGRPVSRENLVVRWDPVRRTVLGAPAEITGYEVIVTKEDHDDPHGFSRPIHDVHVPPGVTSLRVPMRFLEPGTVYELEVLALEVSGNQTIRVGFFETA